MCGGVRRDRMRITVLFLSQQRLLRETLTLAFEGVADVDFLPQVNDSAQVVAALLVKKPDVILVDENPSLSGLKVAKELQEACPSCAILVLASFTDAVANRQFALAGSKGVLSKDIGIADLVAAIRNVAAG